MLRQPGTWNSLEPVGEASLSERRGSRFSTEVERVPHDQGVMGSNLALTIFSITYP